MPRRKINFSDSCRTVLPDMKTGRPAEKNPVPVICRHIRFYREQAGIEQKTLAGAIGVTANSVSNWENGRARPDVNLLPGICSALGISLYDLFGIEDPGNRYTPDQLAAADRFGKLNEGHRYAVKELIESLLTAEDASGLPDIRRLTYYGRSLAAGTGDPTEFETEGEPLYVYSSPDTRKADCVFRVNGDSMEPDFPDGSMVLVQRASEASDIRYGDIGAFIVGNETYIKKYEKDSLYSLNPSYAPMHFDESESVYLIGKVTGILNSGSIVSGSDLEKYTALHGPLHETVRAGRTGRSKAGKGGTS